MKIALCQMNPVIGDIEGNKSKIKEFYLRGVKDKVDLVIFPELALCGYPPLDLIEKKEFLLKLYRASNEIASITNDNTAILFGCVTSKNETVGTGIYNSAILCYGGKVQFIQDKTLLPNYDVFDEVRYFEAAKKVKVFEYKNELLGISICEDIWNDADFWNKRRYERDPVQKLIDQKASILINISASPYAYGKRKERYEMLSTLTKTNGIPLAYVCCAGAQTDLIFDGASMSFNTSGDVCKIGKYFAEDYYIFDTKEENNKVDVIERNFEEEVLDAITLGIKDYAAKTGFKKALVGLSGGIDSALVTYLAVRALGKENVHVVMMPSEFSSEGSVTDSQKLIDNLGISANNISIENVNNSVLNSLEEKFDGLPISIAEENIQARIRGLLLMAISNKFNCLLLATSNKSESAVGYATLYGDMCGALSVIADIFKTDVYRISKYINKDSEIIPFEIINKEPSAELKPDQKDSDSLPSYDILDSILRQYLEQHKEIDEISNNIGDKELVKRILRLVDLNEFKRKQAAPVLKVTTKAFGYGRRFPIVQGWRK